MRSLRIFAEARTRPRMNLFCALCAPASAGRRRTGIASSDGAPRAYSHKNNGARLTVVHEENLRPLTGIAPSDTTGIQPAAAPRTSATPNLISSKRCMARWASDTTANLTNILFLRRRLVGARPSALISSSDSEVHHPDASGAPSRRRPHWAPTGEARIAASWRRPRAPTRWSS